jgi:putative methanogen marker protein 4
MTLIGIGVGTGSGTLLSGIGESGQRSGLVCYTMPRTVPRAFACCRVVESGEPWNDLAADLSAGRIDAAIRGTLPANATLTALKQEMGVTRLERVALLETAGGTKFLLAPVGVDEGWTVAERVELIRKGREIAVQLGLDPRVGVLSGGRFGDAGRHPKVDESLAEAELVARLAGATHYEILIEDAIRECGLIIAPDGISGNLIFRTLVFLGAGKGHGAPVLNIDKIFVDTSRASPDYTNAILLAEKLLEMR